MATDTITLDRVLDEARELTAADQERLRDTIDEWLRDTSGLERERAFLHRLVDAGLMAEVKPPLPPGERPEFEPIANTGSPVSEAIVEDRR